MVIFYIAITDFHKNVDKFLLERKLVENIGTVVVSASLMAHRKTDVIIVSMVWGTLN